MAISTQTHGAVVNSLIWTEQRIAELEEALHKSVTTEYHDELMQDAVNEIVKLNIRIRELEAENALLKAAIQPDEKLYLYTTT